MLTDDARHVLADAIARMMRRVLQGTAAGIAIPWTVLRWEETLARVALVRCSELDQKDLEALCDKELLSHSMLSGGSMALKGGGFIMDLSLLKDIVLRARAYATQSGREYVDLCDLLLSACKGSDVVTETFLSRSGIDADRLEELITQLVGHAVRTN